MSPFLVIWACPLAFEFFLALLPFGFLTAVLSFLIIEISLAPSVGCDHSRDFFMKEKLFRLKKGSQGMYLFQKVKGITKIAFPHFKRKQLRSINFDLIQCDGSIFTKMHFINYEQRVHYIPLFIHFKKNMIQESWGKCVYSFLSFS